MLKIVFHFLIPKLSIKIWYKAHFLILKWTDVSSTWKFLKKEKVPNRKSQEKNVAKAKKMVLNRQKKKQKAENKKLRKPLKMFLKNEKDENNQLLKINKNTVNPFFLFLFLIFTLWLTRLFYTNEKNTISTSRTIL
ncbi:conserved hypothetical protein [Capnocytophaga canimorsus]|nr:conserved hypothetical protein [Capnocytophaga canimorsus]